MNVCIDEKHECMDENLDECMNQEEEEEEEEEEECIFSF